MRKVSGTKKQKVLKKWIKPEVKSEKLSTRSLLGENGWFGSNQNRIAQIAT